MTPDPPDAAALIQRAEYMLSKDSGFFIGGEWRALVSDLLALLTARETAPQTNHAVARTQLRTWLAEDADAAERIAALEAALATAQQERHDLGYVVARWEAHYVRLEAERDALKESREYWIRCRNDVEASYKARNTELIAERDALRAQVAQLRQDIQSRLNK